MNNDLSTETVHVQGNAILLPKIPSNTASKLHRQLALQTTLLTLSESTLSFQNKVTVLHSRFSSGGLYSIAQARAKYILETPYIPNNFTVVHYICQNGTRIPKDELPEAPDDRPPNVSFVECYCDFHLYPKRNNDDDPPFQDVIHTLAKNWNLHDDIHFTYYFELPQDNNTFRGPLDWYTEYSKILDLTPAKIRPALMNLRHTPPGSPIQYQYDDKSKERELIDIYYQYVFTDYSARLLHLYDTKFKNDASDLLTSCQQYKTLPNTTNPRTT